VSRYERAWLIVVLTLWALTVATVAAAVVVVSLRAV
jgi:hypothetical protein